MYFSNYIFNNFQDQHTVELYSNINTAIAWKDHDELMRLDPHKMFINATDSLGNTLAHVAAKMRNLDSFMFLCTHGANLNIANKNGETPLHLVSDLIRDESCIKHLDFTCVNMRNIKGMTPLHIAVKTKNFVMAKAFLKHGADCSIRYRNKTLGHLAAAKNDTKILDLLYLLGVDLQAPDQRGSTPFHEAVKKNARLAIKWFINKQLVDEVNHKSLNSSYAMCHNDEVEKKDKDLASQSEFDQKALERPNKIQGMMIPEKSLFNWNYLSKKVCANDVTFFEETIKKYGVGFILTFTGRIGKNILQYSFLRQKKDIVDIFLRGKIDFTMVDDHGWTLAHFAACFGNLDVVKIMFMNNVNVNLAEKKGQIPLHLAATKGHGDIVRFFLENKSNVNAQSNNLWTPLHCATFNGREAIVDMLINAKADMTMKTDQGLTPLDMAKVKSFKGLIKYLQDRAQMVSHGVFHGELGNKERLEYADKDFEPEPPPIEGNIDEGYHFREEGAEDDLQPGSCDVQCQSASPLNIEDAMQPGSLRNVKS